MGEVHLTLETMRIIALFEKMTGATVKDCLDEPDRLTFVVPEPDLGKAIGKKAANLLQAKEALKRDVEIVGYDADAAKFVRNIFHKFAVTEVAFQTRADGTKIARVKVDPKEKGKAIGKAGRNVQIASKLAARHSDVAEVVVD